MILYHGSNAIVEYPEIRKAKYNKVFLFWIFIAHDIRNKQNDGLRDMEKRDMLINTNMSQMKN